MTNLRSLVDQVSKPNANLCQTSCKFIDSRRAAPAATASARRRGGPVARREAREAGPQLRRPVVEARAAGAEVGQPQDRQTPRARPCATATTLSCGCRSPSSKKSPSLTPASSSTRRRKRLEAEGDSPAGASPPTTGLVKVCKQDTMTVWYVWWTQSRFGMFVQGLVSLFKFGMFVKLKGLYNFITGS